MPYLIIWDWWCSITIINVHAPPRDKDGDIKDSFPEELEWIFDNVHRYCIPILVYFNEKGRQEDMFIPAIGNDSLHEINNNTVVRLINFATSKNLIVKSTTFPHRLM